MTTTLAIELRQERALLIRAQHELAARINGYYPRPTGGPRPLGEVEACAQAERNVVRIREIDRDLATLEER